MNQALTSVGHLRLEPVSTRVDLISPQPFCPLPDFLDNLKTTANAEADLSVPYPASIRCLFAMFQNPMSKFPLMKLHFSDVMPRRFG